MRLLVFVVLALVAACGESEHAVVASPTPTPRTTVGSVVPAPGPVVVRYRLVRHTHDRATDGFAATVTRTLMDRRGWQAGDVRIVTDPAGPYAVVLAEPDEAERLCLPYDVFRKYSCQNGPLVVLNAERWRQATPTWTGSLGAYRQMLVNHEFGHLLGLHHPADPQCPGRGQLAPVMSQQSTELNGCLPNPWPLPAELARLARHDLPLAPPPSS